MLREYFSEPTQPVQHDLCVVAFEGLGADRAVHIFGFI